MLKYAIRKLLLAIPLLLGVLTLVFILLELAPGEPIDLFISPEMGPDARALLMAKYGFDQPAWYRYLLMLYNVFTLDFGISITENRPVLELIADRLPNTIILSIFFVSRAVRSLALSM